MGLLDSMKKIERLAIASYAAPRLRSAHGRKVATLDKDGNIVRYVDLVDVQASLLGKEAIEFDVEGKRPEKALCGRCGDIIDVPARGGLKCFCHACSARPYKCGGGCGRPSHHEAVTCLSCRKASKEVTLTCYRCRRNFKRMPFRIEDTEKVYCSKACIREELPKCFDCGASLSKGVMSKRCVENRKGRPPKCRPCYFKSKVLTRH